MNDNLTPMMRQYRDMKAELPKDVVLLFRLGDFYEMFFEDAKFAAPILDVTLTKRADVPMCGLPYHAIENYLPRLLEAGIKVAIAEQMEDPRFAKGIVKRKITRVITPGTVTDACILSPEKNNFLAALSFIKGTYGLASLDISTGDFRTTEFSKSEELETELHRLHAAECLLPESLFTEWKEKNSQPRVSGNIMWTPLDDWIFATDTATELLKRHFKVASLDGFGCRTMKTGVSAAGAILHYVRENLRNDAGHVSLLKTYNSSQYMVLDSISQRNLELVEPMLGGKKESTLLHVLDHTATPMGSRMLREWLVRPLNSKDAIIARLDAVSAFKDDPVTLAELMEVINSVRDLERIIARLNIGSANARDMAALAKSLESIPDIRNLLKGFDIPLICEIREKLHELPELAAEIGRTVADEPPAVLNEGGIIREGCNAELDELRKASTEGKNWIAELQTKEQARSGIKSLKIRFNNVFGYYIEISKSNLENVPSDYTRKQTLVNGERFITPELKEMESKILGAEDKS
ncbi:MAG: DNA mismatch repair protein MutS, partial [Victivallales bacterium]